MDLSIVIPAFEEGKKIARDVEAAAEFLRANDLVGEILVVDDGSEDNTTEAAQALQVPPEIGYNVIRYEEHRGKGYASACVAAMSQHLLDGGKTFCTLYTDLSNPTSNKIYQNIGYRPVVDCAMVTFKAH